MADRYFDVRKRQGETYSQLVANVTDVLVSTGAERINALGSNLRTLYESQGEGGFLLEFHGEEGKHLRRPTGKITAFATLTYIGATGSLIQRINAALANRDQGSSNLEAE